MSKKNSKNLICPPFENNSEVICIRNSFECHIDGGAGICNCTEGTEYIVEYCIWHSIHNKWLVCITGEFHTADDFNRIEN